MMLASDTGVPRAKLLDLAEQLWPGMSMAEEFGLWLARTPIQASSFMPMIEAERKRLKPK